MRAAILTTALIALHTSLYGAVTLFFGFTADYPTNEQPDGLGLVGAQIDYRVTIDQETYAPDSWAEDMCTADISEALLTITGASVEGVDGTYTLTSVSGDPLQVRHWQGNHTEILGVQVIAFNANHTSLANDLWLTLFLDGPSITETTPQVGDPVTPDDFTHEYFGISLAYDDDGDWTELRYLAGSETFSAVPEAKQWGIWLGMCSLAVIVFFVSRSQNDEKPDNDTA